MNIQTNNDETTGGAAAAMLAAAIGSLAMGMIALLADLRVITLTPLIAPMGGLSTKVALTLLIWGVSWFMLHRSLQQRVVDIGKVRWVALILLALALLGAFPPVWQLFK